MNNRTADTSSHIRIVWIDAFKAFAIILMVMGHATGLFNKYIYQFHMASFFFISGWTAKFDSKSLRKSIFQKIFSLYIPLLTMVLFFAVVLEVLKCFGWYSVFYADNKTLYGQIVDFFEDGKTIDLLGASWFIFVLISASILSNIIFLVSRKNMYVYAIISAMVYVAGYYLLGSVEGIGKFSIYLALLSSGYYALGYCSSKLYKKIYLDSLVGWEWSISAIVSLAVMIILPRVICEKSIMDLASKTVYSLWGSSIAVFNGIVFVVSISHLLAKVSYSKVRNAISFIGKNTYGIMLLHFSAFRVVSAVLTKIGLVSVESCRSLVPIGVSTGYWFLYFVGGVLGSLIIWRGFARIPIFSSALGLNNKLFNWVLEWKVITELNVLFSWLNRNLYVKPNGKTMKNRYFVFAATIIIVLAVQLMPHLIKTVDEASKNDFEVTLETIEEPMEVVFPYAGNNVVFGDGWLPQTEDENYRWVESDSIFYIRLQGQSKIAISGYIPEKVEGISNAKIFLNGTLLMENRVQAGEGIVFEGNIEDIIQGENEIRIVFDAEYVPNEDDVDKRTFSAMFTSIVIE